MDMLSSCLLRVYVHTTAISAVLSLDPEREWSLVNVKTHSWSRTEKKWLSSSWPKRMSMTSSLQGSGNVTEVGGDFKRQRMTQGATLKRCLLDVTW